MHFSIGSRTKGADMTKLAIWALKFLVAYVRRHPEFLLTIAHYIPGHVDDEVLAVVVRLLKQV